MSDDFITGDETDPFDPQDQRSAAAAAKRSVEDDAERLRAALLRRQEAYKRLFAGAPIGDDMQIVMADLRRFCRGDTTTWSENAREHALLTGRQEVWLRISDHLRLSFDDLYTKYV